MRLFYLPNENTEGDQVGPRQAFVHLLNDGTLSAAQAYSYYVERKKHASQHAALRHLHAAIAAFAPDVIFWQHLHDGYPVDEGFFASLKALPSRPKLVAHEADAYGRYVKRMDGSLKRLLAACDLAVVVGLGDLARLVREAGAPRLIYSPNSVDDVRFGQPWQPTSTETREWDALMIANLHCLKRIPWLHLPGGAKRKRLARLFHRAHGTRFAVFGSGQGWQGEAFCRGPVPYDAQEPTLRRAWLSINWGQFDAIPMYASDRLVISLASGAPHITNWQPGYDALFAGARSLFTVRSPEEALDVADELLSRPRQQLIDLGQHTMVFVRQHFSARRVYGELVRAIAEQLFERPILGNEGPM